MLHPSSKGARKTMQGTTGWLKSFLSWENNGVGPLGSCLWRRRCLGIAAWISQGLIMPDDLFAICGEMISVDERRAVDLWTWLQKGFDMISLSILVFRLGHYSLDGWTARCVRNWLTHQALSVALNGSYAALRLIASRVLCWDLDCLASLSKTWRRWQTTLLSSLQMTPNWEGQSICLGTASPSRGTLTVWRNDPTKTSWIQQMQNAKSCAWAGLTPALVQAGGSLTRLW